MAKECEENLQKIVAGFRDCRNAFTAIGDETRQLILRRNAERGNKKLLLSERR